MTKLHSTAALLLGAAGIALWFAVEPSKHFQASPNAAEVQSFERTERFFSGDPDRDVRHGQELRPRW